MLSNRSTPVFHIVAIIGLSIIGFLSGVIIFKSSPYVQSLESRSRELSTFCDTIRRAARSLELQEILDTSVRIIVEITGVRGCSIELLDAATGRMRVRSIAGIERHITEKALNVAEHIYHSGLMNGESVIVRDVYLRDFPAVNDEVESLICVPLRVEEKILGALCIYGKRGQRLSNEIITLLSNLANVISLSIAHAFLYNDLKNLVTTKTRFMLQTSHELRSPLTTIQSIAKTLNAGYLGELSEKQKDAIERIETRARLLSETVNDLLSLAKGRAELSTMRFVKIDLNGIIKECAEFFDLQLKEKDLELDLGMLDHGAFIYGNREALLSIVTNLLSNAIRYSTRGGKIALRLYEEDTKVVLEASDTGIGIPKDDLDSIFEEFYRARNAKTLSKVGTGLGLAIVKSKVEQHGGTISVKSEEGSGTIFRIALQKASR
ncbi:MAG TPA: GAF domain-containing sensor histidine kinase [Spirochaetia bacterium]|nr:GAF domain-containing sensor histidine kinase [Spirochaetia bacterium]